MSKRTPTVWMNITTSLNWQRPPVGIVRVERSLSSELSKLYGSQFRQCVWQGDHFVEWNSQQENKPEETGSSHEQKPISPAYLQKQELPPIFPLLPRKQALIALAQSVLSLLPNKLRPYFNRLLYTLRPRVTRMVMNNPLKAMWARMRRQTTATACTASTALTLDASRAGQLFAPGDILISIGLDWDSSYYKQFYELRKNNGVKVVTCCYDLIPVIYPQYCVSDVSGTFMSYFLEIADGSDLVLCISKQSENDLNDMLERTGGARPPTLVIPMGDNVPVDVGGDISSAVKEICRTPFILFVSTIERRKNHEVLYRAYHLLCKQNHELNLPKLVFVGMQGWGVSELMKDIELDPMVQGMIVRLNHVSDSELRLLYESAQFCVFPSLYEGWGLPVGEALAMGKAVISSDRGSLPEVGGDLVRYVEPWNPQVWAEEIYRMATDDAWRMQWEAKAKQNYHVRSWSDTAISLKCGLENLELI